MFKHLNDLATVTLGLRGRWPLCIESDDDPDATGAGYSPDDGNFIEDEFDETQDGTKRIEDGKEEIAPSTRFKSHEEAEKGFKELQSEKDKLYHAKTQAEQELIALRQLIEANTTDTKTDKKSEYLEERSRTLGRELASKVKKLNQKDPHFHEQFYETLSSTILQEMEQFVPKAASNAARQVSQQERSLQAQGQQAEKDTLAELTKQGLDETYLEDVYREVYYRQNTDPKWDTRVPPEELIPNLVQTVKSRFQERADKQTPRKQARDEQRRSAGNFNGQKARVRQSSDDQATELGSIVGDMRRNKQRMRDVGKSKLQQAGV